MAPATDATIPVPSSASGDLPAPHLSQAYLAQNRAPQIYAAVITITVLATIAVILRFLCRWLMKARILWDDSLIVVALLLEWALSGLLLYETAQLKFGRHVEVLSPFQIMTFSKTLFATQILYYIAQTTIKLSIFRLYHRVFSVNRNFRIALHFIGVLIVAWCIASVLDTIFTCIPVQAGWNKSIPHARCQDLRTAALGTGVSNMILDIIILLLPGPMIWQLHVSKRVKVSLTFIFLLGGLCVFLTTFNKKTIIPFIPIMLTSQCSVCATSVIRIHQILGTNWSATDLTWDSFGVEIWSTIESCTAIISSCLTTMKPLITRANTSKPSSTSTQSIQRPTDFPVRASSKLKSQYQNLDDPAGTPYEMTGLSSWDHPMPVLVGKVAPLVRELPSLPPSHIHC